MKITIVRDDALVGVDGVFRTVDVADLDPTIHAVYFDTTKNHGNVKYNSDRDYQNVWLTDFTPYQTVLDRWTAAEPPPAAPPLDRSDLNNLERGMKALALCIAQIGGLSNEQMKAVFKQKWDSLP